ncbi:tyrosine-protein phosphatase [Alteribacillus iranensis]|uniref:Tyrosine-protein phosphatase n=1 Tax=Alteribacillus iranensis TaxID=930128 RepID=A0A1I2BHB6_9BACI|nr:CpsB/CapC family capsule biosynthesis tyrosine phosphatase [Alteribacillus iranensis]SFE55612.1 protein-tyrosine phosphatase [Alteribacillus iranensis]
MIDLHTHILPGIDDGPQSVEEALDVAASAAANGVSTVVATPHHRNGAFTNPGDAILPLVHSFNQELKAKGVPLTVLAGQENRIHGDLLDELRDGTAITLHHSRYVFIEFPSVEVPAYAKQLFFDIQMEGYVPIIVHPERNKTFVEQPEKLYQFVKNGALTQITARSILNRSSKRVRRFTEQLITHHLTHFMSSDAHNAGSRPFDLKRGYDVVADEIGAHYMETFQLNAARILENKSVLVDRPERIKKKRIMGLF